MGEGARPWVESRSWSGGWGGRSARRRDMARARDVLVEKLSYIWCLFTFPPLLTMKKGQEFLIYLFLFFITQCEACGSGGLTPLFMKKEQWVYQQKLPSAGCNTWQYNCSHYGAVFGFCVCLVLQCKHVTDSGSFKINFKKLDWSSIS